MIKSMTACGSSKKEGRVGSIVCQIQSVNRKHLDLSLQLPDSLFTREAALRLLVSQKVKRGHVQLRLQYAPHGGKSLDARLNRPLANALYSELKSLSCELGISFREEHYFTMLSTQKGALASEINEESQEELFLMADKAVLSALIDLDAMKSREGKSIQEDMQARLKLIERHFQAIKEALPNASLKINERLKKNLAQLSSLPLSDERVSQEIAILAQKGDVTEELLRFELHLKAYADLLSSENGEGKKLEFLLQELFREINTLSVKAQGTEVSPLAIEIKCELEKLREQVQNVE